MTNKNIEPAKVTKPIQLLAAWIDRCHLKGQEGNQIHALLCGVGFNLRKILKKLAQLFWPLNLHGSQSHFKFFQAKHCLRHLADEQIRTQSGLAMS